MTGHDRGPGRTQQKERTRAALVAAAGELADTGGEVTMPIVAATARVSEATAYRYFPDLVTLLREAMRRDDPDTVMAPVADSDDPVERVGHAAEVLARDVVRREGAVRAVVAATVGRRGPAGRPAQRFALVERALAPWWDGPGGLPADERDQLVRALGVVLGAEAVFTLVDLCGLGTDEAVASVVATARRLTAATFAPPPPGPARAR